jgi:hypothetical protein
MILDEGFAGDGTTYHSLTEIDVLTPQMTDTPDDAGYTTGQKPPSTLMAVPVT